MIVRYLINRIRMKFELMDQINRNSRIHTKGKNRKDYRTSYKT